MTTIFLIDFENIQPKDAHLIKADDKIFIFLGEKNNSLKKDLVMALQPHGKNVQYITANGSSRNSLDFHIAYYLGKMCNSNSLNEMVVISNDKGFDNLLAHLRSRKVKCTRASSFTEYYNSDKVTKKSATINKSASVSNIKTEENKPAIIKNEENKPANIKTEENKLTRTVNKTKRKAKPKPRKKIVLTFDQYFTIFLEYLKNNVRTRPSTLIKLERVLKSRYLNKLNDDEIKLIISKILSSGNVKEENNKLIYQF